MRVGAVLSALLVLFLAIAPGKANFLTMEWGKVQNIGANWVTVNLTYNYTDPIVVAISQYTDAGVPTITRVTNITNSTFRLRLQNPGDLSTPTTRDVHYLVVEKGTWTLPDGTKIEAQKYTSTITDGSGSWNAEAQTYQNTYTTPIVLGQVMSHNDTLWSVFWSRGSAAGNPPDSTNIYTGKHVGADTTTTRTDEVIGFIVIEQGHGTLNGIEYDAFLSGDTVTGIDNSPPFWVSYSSSFNTVPQIGIISQVAMDGGDGSWGLLYGENPFTDTQVGVAVDEDQISDTERSHTNEQVVGFIFARAGSYTNDTAPTITNPKFNVSQVYAENPIKFNVSVEDLGGANVSWVKATFRYPNGTLLNVSLTQGNYPEWYTTWKDTSNYGRYNVTGVYAYDGYKYAHIQSMASFVSLDPSPSQWSSNSTNATIAGWAVEHRVYWQDPDSLSGFIFSFHNGVNATETNQSADAESGMQANLGDIRSGQTYVSTLGQDVEDGIALNISAETIVGRGIWHSQANPERIYVNESGVFKISYGCVFTETTGANRVILDTWIRKNGASTVVPSKTSCYIRYTTSDGNRCSNKATLLANLSAGDYVELFAQKNHGVSGFENVTESCWLKIYPQKAPAAQMYDNNGGDAFSESTGIVVSVDTTTHASSGFTPDTANNRITVTQAGTYRAYYHVCSDSDAQTTRSTPETYLRVNGAQFNPSTTYSYLRDSSNGDYNCEVGVTVLNLSSSDYVDMWHVKYQTETSGANSITLEKQSWLLLEKIPTNSLMAYDNAGGQSTTDGISKILTFDTNYIVGSSYTHTTGSSKIFINETGWHDVAYTLSYVDDGGGDRAVTCAQILKNGIAQLPSKQCDYTRGDDQAKWHTVTADTIMWFNEGDYIELEMIPYGSGASTTANSPIVSIVPVRALAEVSEDENSSYIQYDHIFNTQLFDQLTRINITVQVSAYDNGASSERGNSNPDLWLQLYDGDGWTDLGKFGVTGTGTFSISTTDGTLLKAWGRQSNRNLRIKVINLDYWNATENDKLNFTGVWATIDSLQQFFNDSWRPIDSNSAWTNVTKKINSTDGAIIQWRVWVNDSYNHWNSTPTFTYTAVDDKSGPFWSDNQTQIVPTYSPTAKSYFNITWIDDYLNVEKAYFDSDFSGFDTNYTMLQNGDVFQFNRTLPAGTYYWKSWAEDSKGNWNVSNTWWFTISKANPNVNLTINDTDSNYSVFYYEDVPFKVYLDFTDSVKLYIDNSLKAAGNAPLSDSQSFSTLGRHNITGLYEGNQNYTSDMDTLWLTVFGKSQVDWLSPINSKGTPGDQIRLECNITDSFLNKPIEDYLAQFWVDDVLIGTNNSIASGSVSYVWDTAGYSTGAHSVKCNISDSQALYYNATTAEDGSTVTLISLGTPALTVLTPDLKIGKSNPNDNATVKCEVVCSGGNCEGLKMGLQYNDGANWEWIGTSNLLINSTNPILCGTASSCSGIWDIEGLVNSSFPIRCNASSTFPLDSKTSASSQIDIFVGRLSITGWTQASPLDLSKWDAFTIRPAINCTSPPDVKAGCGQITMVARTNQTTSSATTQISTSTDLKLVSGSAWQTYPASFPSQDGGYYEPSFSAITVNMTVGGNGDSRAYDVKVNSSDSDVNEVDPADRIVNGHTGTISISVYNKTTSIGKPFEIYYNLTCSNYRCFDINLWPRYNSTATVDTLAPTSKLEGAFKMEWGVLQDINSSWVKVNLTYFYTDPVIVAVPQYTSTAVPVVTRITNVTNSSFLVKLQNPGNINATNPLPVHYIVVEKGKWTLPDGRKIEAQKYTSKVTDTASSWNGEAQSYLNTYTNPVVIGQVMSYNDSRWSVFWSRGDSAKDIPTSTTIYTGKHVGEDSATTRNYETVGFIVAERGHGTLNGLEYDFFNSTNSVQTATSGPYWVDYSSSFSNTPEVGIVGATGMNGVNGGWPVLVGSSPFTTTQIGLGYDEDQIGDTERTHIAEEVGVFVFESDGSYTNTSAPYNVSSQPYTTYKTMEAGTTWTKYIVNAFSSSVMGTWLMDILANSSYSETDSISSTNSLLQITNTKIISHLLNVTPQTIMENENTTAVGNCVCSGGTCTNSKITIQYLYEGTWNTLRTDWTNRLNANTSSYTIGTLTGASSNYTFKITGLVGGNYPLRIQCSSDQDTSSSGSITLHVNDYPKFANFSVNATLIYKNQFAKFNASVTDEAGLAWVNFTINEVNYTAVQNGNEWYYLWKCLETDSSVPFTFARANDTEGYYNETAVSGVQTACDANPPTTTNARINDTSIVNIYTTVKVNATASDPEGHLDTVWIEVLPPVSSSYNTSTQVSGSEYYIIKRLDEVGIWQFRFWANDTGNQANNTLARDGGGNQFINVEDLIKPTITQVEVNTTLTNSLVKINASITDNVAVEWAWFNINGTNHTAIQNGDEWYLNWVCSDSNYYVLEEIWANDTYSNWALNNSFTRYFYCDVSPPTYSAHGQDTAAPIEGTAHKVYALWKENYANLDWAILSTNKSGIWLDDAKIQLSGKSAWSNFTIDTSGKAGQYICWKIRANNTLGDWNNTMPQTCFTVWDVTPPTYSGDSDDSLGQVDEGVVVNASATWSDNLELDWATFRTNKTGSWQNESFLEFTSTPQDSDFHIQTTGHPKTYMCWNIWANDSYGNLNNSMPNHCFWINDVTPPKYSAIQDNTTGSVEAGEIVKVSAYWTDDVDLDQAVMKYNDTGSWHDDGTYFFSSNPEWSNFTIGTTGLDSAYVCWWVRATDKSGNLNNTMPYSCFQIVDTRAPYWSSNSTSTPVAGHSTEHRIYWRDYGGLAGYVFSFDNCTGSFVNDSYVQLSGINSWVNISKVLNFTEGCTIRWQVWMNDTAGNMNASKIFTYQTIKNDPPQWFSNQTNLTLAGWPVKHSTYWTDDAGFSGYIFSFNNGHNSTERNESSNIKDFETVRKMGTGFLVQQGEYYLQGTDAFIPLKYQVDPQYTVVLTSNLMAQENVTADSTGDPAMTSDNGLYTIYVYNSTHLRVQRGSSSDGTIIIGWQVLEALDKEFFVQRGEKILTNFIQTSTTDNLTYSVNPKNSMAWHYLQTTYTGNDGRVVQFVSNITSNNTISFQRSLATSISGSIRWSVIEWNTSRIGGFYKGYVEGYGTESAPFFDAIGATINPSHSILIFQTHAIDDDGLDTSNTVGYIYNNTHVAFYNYDSTYNRGIEWYVIDFGDGARNKITSGPLSWASTDYFGNDTLSTPLQKDRALAWFSMASNGDGTAKPRHTAFWSLQGNSTHATNFHYERRYTGQATVYRYSALELPRDGTEVNKTPVIFPNVIAGQFYEHLTNISVKIQIQEYITRGSDRKGNAKPDIWVEFFTGTGWVGKALGITSTGNFTVSTQDPAVLSAWKDPSLRMLRIRITNADEYNSTDYDLGYGNGIWVYVDSVRDMFNNSWVPLSGTSAWINVSKVVNSTVGTLIKWRVCMNDSFDFWNCTPIFTYNTQADNTPPQWSNNQTNDTQAGEFIEHSTYWQDNGGIAGYIFSFDNCTGSFVNDTWKPHGNGWINVTKRANFTLGCTIRWQVWVNDSWGGLWNHTPIFSYKTVRKVNLSVNQVKVNNTNPKESEWVLIQANISNWASKDALSTTIIFKDTNSNRVTTTLGTQTLTIPTNSWQWINLTQQFGQGSHTINVSVSAGANMEDISRGNNWNNTNLTVPAWAYFYGNVSGTLLLAKSNDTVLKEWTPGAIEGTIYYMDADADFDLFNPKAFTNINELNTLDKKLQIENFTDSLKKEYDSNNDNSFDHTHSFYIHGEWISGIPIVNVTDSSPWLVGIVWDGNDGGTSYDGTQDVAFVAEIKGATQGAFGYVNYEAKVPSNLKSLKGSINMIATQGELK